MYLPLEIFREYDIRGIYPDQLNKENIFYFGKGIGTLLKRRGYTNVVLGHDTRRSSEPLSESIIKGIISTGCNVTYVGITIQPAIHYFSFLKSCDAVINITASHNTKEYNGIKADFKGAEPFTAQDYKDTYDLTIGEDFETGEGTVSIKNLNTQYINELSSKFKLKNKIKVLINCRNGSASQIAPQVLKNIGAEVIENECTFDPDFPKGVPDPEKPPYVEETSELVRKYKADVGLEFDGDGDRFGTVDEKGGFVSTDYMIVFFASDILSRHKSAKFLYDVKCSQIVESEIRRLGGVPEMMRTGRTFFLKQTLAKSAIFGAEFSGHMFFADEYYGYDDAIYAACRLLKILDEGGLPYSKYFKNIPHFESTPEFQIPCSDDEKFNIVKDIYESIKGDERFKEISTVDGVRVKVTDKSWFLLRAKNTSPFLTLRAEAETKEDLEKVLTIVVNVLAKYKHLDLNTVNIFK